MTFSVELHPRVEAFLEKLEPLVAERIRAKLRHLKDAPFRFLKHYAAASVYKLRIGDYRALVDVDQTEQVVYVQHMDHRKRIYKKK